MDQLPGAVGSSGSLALRVGQLIFSVASIAFMYMGIPFHSYTAFCFLMVVMSLVMIWSLIFALMDLFSVHFKALIHLPAILDLALLGDCALSFLCLAASILCILAAQSARGIYAPVINSSLPWLFCVVSDICVVPLQSVRLYIWRNLPMISWSL